MASDAPHSLSASQALLSALHAVRHFFEVPWLAVGGLVLGITWWYLGLYPWALPFAVIITHPPIVTGLAMWVVIGRYERNVRRLRSSRSPSTVVVQARAAYGALSRISAVIDLMGGASRRAVLVAHQLMCWALMHQRAADDVNAVNDPFAGAEHKAILMQHRRLSALCDFVLATASDEDDMDRRSEFLEKYLELVPESNDYDRMRATATVTYKDGPGFLTTLFCLYEIDLVLSLPESLNARAVVAFNALQLRLPDFGWLCTRVLQAVLAHSLSAARDVLAVRAAIQPRLDEIAPTLAVSDSVARYQAQWRGKRLLQVLTA